MAQVTIDSVPYEFESLSDKAKQLLVSLRAADAEMARLQTQLAIASTARAAYASALKAELPVQPGKP
jgi:hypothetical protein